MRSTTSMRAAKIGYIIISSAFCAFGVILLCWPRFSITLLGTLVGIAMIVFGAVKLIGYFSKDLFRLAFQYDLAFGILLAALGVILLVRPGNMMDFLFIALGISVLTDGLFKIQIAVDAKSFGLREWWLILIFAVLTGFAGLLLAFRPAESAEALVMLLGAALVTDGIMSLITVLSAVKIIRHQRPDVIYTEHNEFFKRKE